MRKLALIILDGWGIGESKANNAIHHARTPFFDSLINRYPHTALQASGHYVGLPQGQIGGSEVGHLTIGAGRVILQELKRINQSLEKPDKPEGIATNTVFQQMVHQAKKKPLHIIGLVSSGGVHSSEDHLLTLLKILQKHSALKPFIHFISDGRDTMPKSSVKSAKKLEYATTLIGRYYAMDRDENWERTDKAMALYIKGKGKKEKTLQKAIQNMHQQEITDEFIEPIILDITFKGIKPGEPAFFLNFRADRMKQLIKRFEKLSPKNPLFTMTRYDERFKALPLFEKRYVEGTLGSILESLGLTQLKATETEKSPHVTYFFHGGADVVFKGEKRTIEKSNAFLHNKAPQMKAQEIRQNIIKSVEIDHPDFILVNFANPDMVGHTGDFDSVVTAVESVDDNLKKLCAYLVSKQYICCITADHGNAEVMFDLETKEKHTAHTLNQVPFIIYDPLDAKNQSLKLRSEGGEGLSYIAGTVLHLMGTKGAKQPFETLLS